MINNIFTYFLQPQRNKSHANTYKFTRHREGSEGMQKACRWRMKAYFPVSDSLLIYGAIFEMGKYSTLDNLINLIFTIFF